MTVLVCEVASISESVKGDTRWRVNRHLVPMKLIYLDNYPTLTRKLISATD